MNLYSLFSLFVFCFLCAPKRKREDSKESVRSECCVCSPKEKLQSGLAVKSNNAIFFVTPESICGLSQEDSQSRSVVQPNEMVELKKEIEEVFNELKKTQTELIQSNEKIVSLESNIMGLKSQIEFFLSKFKNLDTKICDIEGLVLNLISSTTLEKDFFIPLSKIAKLELKIDCMEKFVFEKISKTNAHDKNPSDPLWEFRPSSDKEIDLQAQIHDLKNELYFLKTKIESTSNMNFDLNDNIGKVRKDFELFKASLGGALIRQERSLWDLEFKVEELEKDKDKEHR